MSNLGWYQIMTTMAKKVGGPKKFLGLLIGGSYVLGVTTVIGVKALKNKISSELDKSKQVENRASVYTVNEECCFSNGVHLKKGDRVKVLVTDGDTGIIEIIGKKNNPFVVSLKMLSSISDYIVL